MRCPKCQYISFDSAARCRNCGYEMALAEESAPLEVRIAREQPSSVRGDDPALALDRALVSRPEAGERHGATSPDLPLFTDRVADDQAPLVTPPAVPRAPLAVRKAAARPRPRATAPDELPLDLAVEPEPPSSVGEALDLDEHRGPAAAGLGRRIAAGIVDTAILGSISTAVVVLTLRVSELTSADWRLLPPVPMLAFLLLLCGGYFVLFTAAGGQTIGKMTARIRVVNAEPELPARVEFRTAVVRTVAAFGSLLLLGAGFLLAAADEDHRTFHDKVAATRVIAL